MNSAIYFEHVTINGCALKQTLVETLRDGEKHGISKKFEGYPL